PPRPCSAYGGEAVYPGPSRAPVHFDGSAQGRSIATMVDLRERVAVVTGAGRGIGRAYALRMAAYGARVVVNDAGVATDGSSTDEDPAADVVAEIVGAGGDAIAQHGDIADATVGDALVA